MTFFDRTFLSLAFLLTSQAALAQLQPCVAGAPGTRETVAIKNASFDEVGPPSGIRDWQTIEHVHPGHYVFERETQQPHSPPVSAKMKRVGDEDFGSLQQTFVIKSCWVGKKAVLSGFLRSQDVTDVGGALILQANGGGGDILSWNHMNENKVRGTTPWTKHSIEIPIPPNTYVLRFGYMLEGPGALWADDLKLEIVY